MTAPGYSVMLRAMARRSVVFRRCVDRTAQIGCQVISERSVAVREVERQRAEVERLRAALNLIAHDGCEDYADNNYDSCEVAGRDHDAWCGACLAREVLAGQGDTPPAEPTIPFDPDRVAADYQPIPRSEVPPLGPPSTEPAPEPAASFTRGYQLGQLHRRESVAKEAEAHAEPAPVQPDAETIDRAAKAACDFYWDKWDSEMFAAEGHVWRSVVRAVAAELGLPTGETQGGADDE